LFPGQQLSAHRYCIKHKVKVQTWQLPIPMIFWFRYCRFVSVLNAGKRSGKQFMHNA